MPILSTRRQIELEIPATFRLDEASSNGLQIVQFVGPIKDEWLKTLRDAGVTPIQYIANHAYLVWANDSSRTQLNNMADENNFLQYSAPYQPYFKLGAQIRNEVVNPSTVSSAESIPVVIQIYNHPGNLHSKEVIRSLSINQISDWSPILAYENAIITLRISDLAAISQLSDVVWLNQKLAPELTDEVQGQILAGNFDATQSGPSGPGYLTWLNSYSFSTDPSDYPIVDVTDDGIGNGTVNSGDPTLHQTGNLANPTRLSYVANCTDSADGGGPDGHGHINVSIVGGYDTTSGFPFVDPLGYQRGLGINPFGRLAGTRIFDASGYDISSCSGTDTGVIKSVQDNGALINTNSWGCSGCAGSYDDSSQAYDVGVRDADLTETGNQEMIIVFSAGNSGSSANTIGTPGNGKNMITVGASENDRPSDEDGNWTDGCGIGPIGADNAMDVISFSSRGPAPGGRVKPEIIAPGTHIQGTASTNASYNGSGVCDQYRPSGQTIFASSSGTSHSTPAVAGVSSLAYWWLENTYSLTPSPAMMKAYLIAHPTYLTGVSANDTLPSNNQGYGMPNMSLMFDTADKYLLDQSVIFDNSGETWTWSGGVADNTKPVRIVLVYTDAPGAIGTSPQVNDLNLSATVDSSTYLGNIFTGQWSATGGTADSANNYEAIFLPASTTGSINITVTGFNIAGDGVPNVGDSTDQDFAIVCYNCSQTPDFTVDATPAALDICLPDDADYNVSVGAINGFSDPVTLSVTGNPGSASFSTNPVTPPGSSTMTISGAGAGNYTLAITGTGGSPPILHTDNVDLNVSAAAPTVPTLTTPADTATGVPVTPTFSWSDTGASSYLLEVATDSGFSNIVYSVTETNTSHTAGSSLSTNTEYYWRITAQNGCGSSPSSVFSFTTQTGSLVCNGSVVDFNGGLPVDWSVIDNESTGVVWTLTGSTGYPTDCGESNYTGGSGAAVCASSDQFGAAEFDTEVRSGPFDLTGFASAALTYEANYANYVGLDFLNLEISTNGGSNWTNLLSWNEDHHPNGLRVPPGESVNVDLSAYLGMSGLLLRWHYYDPNLGDWGWYAQFDDVALTCVSGSPPVIEVNPVNLEASLIPDVQITQTLIISNTGGSDLDWTIFEDSETSIVPPPSASSLSSASNLLQFGESNVISGTAENNNALITPNALQAIIDQAPNQSNGIFSDSNCDGCDNPQQVLAENFTLSVDATITSIVMWGGYFPGNTPASPDVFTVIIHQDSSGLPGTTLSTENNVPYTRVQTGVVLFGVDEWMHTLTLANPVILTPGSYWIEIYNDTGTGTDDYFWEVSNADTIGNGIIGSGYAFEAPGVSWNLDAVNDFAIQLIGDIVATCDVPTDITWLNISTTSGTITPDLSDALDVIYDSTGLATGEYTSTLCIDSNDPVTPQVQVPVTMTVCTQPATVTDVSISRSGNDVTLNWTAVPGATAYRIYRATNNPYYTPGISFIYDLTPTNTYTDLGAAGDIDNNYYYVVQVVNSCGASSVESEASNRTAEFDYPIQPGTP